MGPKMMMNQANPLPRVMLGRLLLAVGMCLAGGCLPDTYDDTQLANWCGTDADCATKDGFVCYDKSTCVANQCQAGVAKPPTTVCATTTCKSGCACGSPKHPTVKPGVCGPK